MGLIWTADDGDISQYPFDSRVPRKLVIAGKYKRKLTQLKEQADRKRFRGDAAGNPSERICSESHLQNIRAARDEHEARNLKAVFKNKREE